MKKTLKTAVITLISFAVYFILQKMYFKDLRTSIDIYLNNLWLSHFIVYVIVGLPLFAGVMLMHNYKEAIGSLGLNKSITTGFTFALICTLPMLIGYAFVFKFKSEITLSQIIINALCAGFFEELYFRGFLFGQLYRFTKIGFIPSIITCALVFALAHLYQSQDPATLIGIFLTTFMGAILFAWVYVEWNNNLWVPVFLHLFMNLFWSLFSAGDNAFGGIYSNIFRAVTIIMIITLTILYKTRKHIKLEVTRKTVWMKK